MLLIKNAELDPYFNLAAEQYLLECQQGDIFMLWRNGKAVVIGKNQNTFAEVDTAFAEANGIKIVRRLTGGGAVFHDEGNVNFTFITDAVDGKALDFGRFVGLIVEALGKMGVCAHPDGRNDIVTSGGAKISGNAQCVYNTADGRARLMHHGTLLFSADVSQMAGVLRVNDEKLRAKGVKSVPSRVANIANMPSYCGPADAEGFMDGIFRCVAGHADARGFSRDEAAEIKKLADEKYSSWEWNFGASLPHSDEKRRRFQYGTVEVRLNASHGRIEKINIGGDFFGAADICELCSALCGEKLEKESLLRALNGVERYISGATAEDIAALILD